MKKVYKFDNLQEHTTTQEHTKAIISLTSSISFNKADILLLVEHLAIDVANKIRRTEIVINVKCGN